MLNALQAVVKIFGSILVVAEFAVSGKTCCFFHKLGLPGAKVVASGEETRFGIFQRGALITEEAVNTSDLLQMVLDSNPLLKDREWVSQVIAQVASAAKTMHENNFIHIDFKWRNILVTPDKNPQNHAD